MNRDQKKDPIPTALLVLTLVTGLVDAVSVLALGHVFTANMTGNVVFLAFAVSGAPGFSIGRSLVSLAAFFVGAVLGGRFFNAMAETSKRRWVLSAMCAEAGLLFIAAWVSAGLDRESAGPQGLIYAAIVLMAVAMGLRNATVRQLAVEAAAQTNRVLALPAPVCHITEFGDNAVTLLLRFWIGDPADGVKNVTGDVYLALWDSFREHGVELPFPQREIRIRELPAALARPATTRSAAE